MAHAELSAPPLRPPLKWAGGKRWLVPRLRELWAASGSTRLVEPFCGGLSVAIGLAPRHALLGDANAHSINFYRYLQRGLQVRIAMRNDETLYYAHRDAFNRLVTGRGASTRKAAELFYFLNRTGYNGLCRFNRRGEFNVPFGRYASIAYRRDFAAYRDALARWMFRQGDFGQTPLQSGDFVYADPPYDVEFRQYSKDGFEWDEQERLAEWLTGHDGPVVLSNQATGRVCRLYRSLGYRLRYFDAPRRISCNGDRRPAREVLATRNVCA